MAENRFIKASEIGEYLYCRRSWWLHHVKGIEPGNIQELKSGVEAHRLRGGQVKHAEALGKLAVLLLFLALLLLSVWCLWRIGLL